MQRQSAVAAFFLLLSLLGCNSLEQEYRDMIGKEINIGCAGYHGQARFKIVDYVSKEGCSPCRLQPAKWKRLSAELDSIPEVDLLLIVETDSVVNSVESLPIYFVPDGKFSSSSSLPADERFHCFLLDSANRVMLIGNPVQNPRIKDLFVRTICQQLGVDRPNKMEDSQQTDSSYHDFGAFPYSEVKETDFVLSNISGDIWRVDTVYSSCLCTTAVIDRTEIQPGGSARISVSFKADKTGAFMREVYVKAGGNVHTFTIRGEVE